MRLVLTTLALAVGLAGAAHAQAPAPTFTAPVRSFGPPRAAAPASASPPAVAAAPTSRPDPRTGAALRASRAVGRRTSRNRAAVAGTRFVSELLSVEGVAEDPGSAGIASAA